jgi:hypothetical protein
MRSGHPKHRGIKQVACATALALALVSLQPRPAKAELTIATVSAVVGLIGDIGDSLSKWEWLFDGSGPRLSNQVNAVKVAIVNELRTQRNQELKASAQTVFDDFAILGARPKSDPNNETMRADALEQAKNTFNWYHAIVTDKNFDLTSSYELAPMFTVLTQVLVGLTKMKGELRPKYPAVWLEYHTYLIRAMQDSDLLVGTQVAGCWPGYNPGRNRYSVGTAAGTLTAGSVKYDYIKSPLWKKKLAKGSITIPFAQWGNLTTACKAWHNGQYNGVCGRFEENMYCTGSTLDSNPSCSCPNIITGSNTECLRLGADIARSIANNLTTGAFGSNGVVKVIRKGMSSIQLLGGGDDRWSGNTIPTAGDLTDPWLDEDGCGPFGPWSYVATP